MKALHCKYRFRDGEVAIVVRYRQRGDAFVAKDMLKDPPASVANMLKLPPQGFLAAEPAAPSERGRKSARKVSHLHVKAFKVAASS